MKVGVIDYGVGNLGSVLRALEEMGVTPVHLQRAADVRQPDALILPGVGGFTECKRLLDAGGWSEAIKEATSVYAKPLLGICLGMQLLADSSEEGANGEGGTPGLGLISGHVTSLKELGCSLRVPHVGWNSVYSQSRSPLMKTIPDGTDFYFVHSYAFVPRDQIDVLATTDHDVRVTAVVGRGHVWGTQFHPEKSSRAGFRLLRNFLTLSSC